MHAIFISKFSKVNDMPSRIMFLVFHIVLALQFSSSEAKTWVRTGYYLIRDFPIPPISGINSALFTHLVCSFACLNSTSYHLSLSPHEEEFTNCARTVKEKNPSLTTLLSIGGEDANCSGFSSMASNTSYRKTFIDSSIKIARDYGFQGLDLSWVYPNTSADMLNLRILIKEWRAATELEARNSRQSQLILTARVRYSPRINVSGTTYPVDSIQQYLNWVHIMAHDYHTPTSYNFTAAHAALYDPKGSSDSTDYGIRAWIDEGLSSHKMVLCLPMYGYAWTLANEEDNGIGAPATGPAISPGGFLSYKEIMDYINLYEGNVMYSETYGMNYWTRERDWIGFDDVKAVRSKVSYAKKNGLLGYYVWRASYDDDWKLSYAAAHNDTRPWLVAIIFVTTAVGILLIGYVTYYFCQRNLKSKGTEVGFSKASKNSRMNNSMAAGVINSNVPNLKVLSFPEIEAATNRFSIENKLGEGGFGPVYKGVLSDGQEIAVKKLSKRSKQGFSEFENEVRIAANLQHVNLVRLLGFCVDREEQMLIYEYMPNKSLDYYLYDPMRQNSLDWGKRVGIIEGVAQGLLYLQEYSRQIIIHRDLKVSNILLDEDMKPKISDFGLARIFPKNDLEANTSRIVGTLGYLPPEYVKKGIYSTKSDVYSFGVLLLEIISGKKVSLLFGANENLVLLEYAYELWKNGRGMEFMDPSLDDTHSSCKLTRCLQIALLCVQENPNERPSMLEVYSMLKNETTEIMNPKKPAFATQVDKDEQNKSTMRPEICSVNEVTISEMVPR